MLSSQVIHAKIQDRCSMGMWVMKVWLVLRGAYHVVALQLCQSVTFILCNVVTPVTF